MSDIKIEAFKYVLSSLNDGWLFENFAKSFLTGVTNYEFVPVGGVKDKGVDGFEHTLVRNKFQRQIYQISTEKDAIGKITRTINTLRSNDIKFDVLTYVTNRDLQNKDQIIDSIMDAHSVPLKIYDLSWFTANLFTSQATQNAYLTYIENNFHEFNKPGKSFVVSKIDTDSRIFVFLRQQLESKGSDFKIDELLADSLILFALEGTDPERDLYLSKTEIISAITTYVKFDPKLLEETIANRLKTLSTKPRKIKFNEAKGYCLPYETRIEITQRNLSDIELQKTFYEQTEEVIRKFLDHSDVRVKDLTKLIDEVVHKIFYQQGLEFSNFILSGQSKKSVDKDLQQTINLAVDESSVIEKNKTEVKSCLLVAIRSIIYNGTPEQRHYLKSLSNTYMMMFLLQWNPQVALYFESMAAKLKVFVCTSIIIPALSEYYLDEENKRHWNLLKASRDVGLTLFITEPILDELISHLRMIKNKYESLFQMNEEIYLESELHTLFIDEVLIRAYYYAKTRGLVKRFDSFIENFCDYSIVNVKEDLIEYLKDEFGIEFRSEASLKIKINSEEKDRLVTAIERSGKPQVKAKTDSQTILTIYELRQLNNEISSTSIFGYRTWWLSKDITTYRAVRRIFKEKYPISCYMRPDFLYNHIALAPKKYEIDVFYKKVFPSLLGINLSFHLPKDVTEYVQTAIADHNSKNPARVKAIIRKLSENLKSDPSARTYNNVKLFLDEELVKQK